MTPHLLGMTCPICNSSLAMPMATAAQAGDVFVCPACIGVIGVGEGDCCAIPEADLLRMRAEEPELVAQLEERRIELARHWVFEGQAPTIFAAVAAQMYVTRGSQSLRLPGRDQCP